MAAMAIAAPFRTAFPYSAVPRISASALLQYSPIAVLAGQWWQPKLPTLSAALPAISLNIPGLLQELWDGILRAVPKKKTSYSKKRMRQMAGKALEDVTSLCKCPACGRVKKMHVLCEHCTRRIIEMWRYQDRTESRKQQKLEAEQAEAAATQ